MEKMEDILEGNKLIAEFMGAEVMENSMLWFKEYHPIKKVKCIHLKGVKYRTSWDWLMPVVDKIEATETTQGNFEVYLFKRCCDIQTAQGNEHIIEVTGSKTKIEAAWRAIVMLLEWLNKEKKMNG